MEQSVGQALREQRRQKCLWILLVVGIIPVLWNVDRRHRLSFDT